MMVSKTPIFFTPVDSRLVFIKETVKPDIKNGVYRKALYECKCGKEVECRIKDVKSGYTKSCGCLRKERIIEVCTTHGKSKTHPLYYVWFSMIGRCYNIKNRAYEYYGGSGVTVCDEWRNDFMTFYNWAMANGWKKKMVVDKDIKAKQLGITPKYCPELCSIITQKENTQLKNKTRHDLNYWKNWIS